MADYFKQNIFANTCYFAIDHVSEELFIMKSWRIVDKFTFTFLVVVILEENV